MGLNQAYVVTEEDDDSRRTPWTITKAFTEDQVYTYDEALDLAGNGFYNLTLLATLSVATLSMAVDIFGFSVVVNGANCDLNLGMKETGILLSVTFIRNGFYNLTLLATLSVATLSMAVDIFGFSVVVNGANCDLNLGMKETGILLSVTFIGPIVMAYPWGFIADTQGRRKSLIISLWTSFLVSAASAFSPNWITLAVLKFISTSFSSCAQSATYTLLGECCSQRFRDVYMLIMTSILDFSLAIYVAIAFMTSNLEFAYDLGFITFTPWRLLAILLSLITGLGAFGVLFFYESPKFLLNAEKNEEALKVLAGIWRANGGKNVYPVKKVVLTEVGNTRHRDQPLWRSMYEQVTPLFKPPLLWRSLQLYFITAVVYGTNNGYFMWLPYLGEQFVKSSSNSTNGSSISLCSMLHDAHNLTSNSHVDCSSNMDITILWFSLAQGGSFVLLLFSITRVAHRKRLVMIVILAISGLSGFGAVLIKDMTTSFLMFLGVLLNQLVIGLIYAYYIDLYPTSFRGMAACLSTMVARSSALAGVTLMGNYLMTNCSNVFYVSSGLMMGGVFVAFTLPKDKSRKTKP